MNIILASQSPRRKELLEKLGHSLQVCPADTDETIDASLPVDEALEQVAYVKAKSVQSRFPGQIIVAADTIVVYKDEILGKPQDAAEAADVLVRLSGDTHQVKTGVCILTPGEEITFTDTAEVKFKDLCDQQILDYVSRGTCLDKAGSYGIQECDFVQDLVGSYDNVMGLPTEKVEAILAELQ